MRAITGLKNTVSEIAYVLFNRVLSVHRRGIWGVIGHNHTKGRTRYCRYRRFVILQRRRTRHGKVGQVFVDLFTALQGFEVTEFRPKQLPIGRYVVYRRFCVVHISAIGSGRNTAIFRLGIGGLPSQGTRQIVHNRPVFRSSVGDTGQCQLERRAVQRGPRAFLSERRWTEQRKRGKQIYIFLTISYTTAMTENSLPICSSLLRTSLFY